MPEPLNSFEEFLSIQRRRRKGRPFDMTRAMELNFERDLEGHMPSRDPSTGRILKSLDHPTFYKSIIVDSALGFQPFVEKDTGEIFTLESNPDPSRFQSVDVMDLIKFTSRFRKPEISGRTR